MPQASEEIVIIDYGMGNLGSIANMLKRIGARCRISSLPEEIAGAGKLILPGVGAFAQGMRNLEDRKLIPSIEKAARLRRVPLLGICLGMQLLTRCSEEGKKEGLGWIPAETRRFRLDPAKANLKVPHMGWNDLRLQNPHVLFEGLETQPRYYFVHSFHLQCDRMEDVLAWTTHGYEFPAAVARENLCGVQFHPEKSHRFGLTLLKNFAERM